MAFSPQQQILAVTSALGLAAASLVAQEPLALPTKSDPAPFRLVVPQAKTENQPYPINLPTALALAQARPLDIALAGQRLEQALAQEQRAVVS